MRRLNFKLAVPVASFTVAVALSWLGGGPIGSVLARQAGDATACKGKATAQSITVAAGSGIKKGTAGWSFSILDQPIDLQHTKTAGLNVIDDLTLDFENVIGIDTNNKKHPYGKVSVTVFYQPFPVYNNESLPPPGQIINAIPATISYQGILGDLKNIVTKKLNDQGFQYKNMQWDLKAQTTYTHQYLTSVCSDGTDLPTFPRPDTLVPVDAKGNGNPVKN